MKLNRWIALAGLAGLLLGAGKITQAQSLEQRLTAEDPAGLAQTARQFGDARRGAIIFYQPYLACRKCHLGGKMVNPLGPDLAKPTEKTTDAHIVESVLNPSKIIKKGFEPVTVVTTAGKTIVGLLVKDGKNELTLRDPARNGLLVKIPKNKIEEQLPGRLSIMPAGQVNLLASRQQFLDLIRYLIEIRDGGAARVRELEPPPALFAARPLPEYEKHIDHAGMLSSLDQDSFKRGEAIYNRLCINCHGTHDRPGSLPTSLRFASGKFKNGSDPHTMYQTLTRGFGMMAPQTWMVPQQKYDVIHYVRQAYLKTHNPTQLFPVEPKYLAGLPKGDTRGPEPSNILPWEQMDYGPNLVMTLEVGNDGKNFAYKGNAVRLDAGPGGVSQGRYWMLFDYDTLRVSAAWSGEGFSDWNGINFNGRHNIHPRVKGAVHLANPTGPGWGSPADGSFEDVRFVGRDDRKYGPLPRKWAHYKGMYYYGQQTIVEYTVGKTRLLEMPGVVTSTPQPVFTRTLNIGPRDRDLLLQVAHRDHPGTQLVMRGDVALFGPRAVTKQPKVEAVADASQFNGGTRLEIGSTKGINLKTGDFTVTARIKTKANGTILAQTDDTPKWVPNGLTWFIRGGRLAVDIGWVGAFQGQRVVADGKWHQVAFSYKQKTGEIRLYIDGKPEQRTGKLKRKAPLKKPVVRIGYTAANFPNPTFFKGEIPEVRYYNAVLSAGDIEAVANSKLIKTDALAAHWDLTTGKNNVVLDKTGREHDGQLVVGETAGDSPSQAETGWTVAGAAGNTEGLKWLADNGDLRLRIPAGRDPLRLTVWFASIEKPGELAPLVDAVALDRPDRDLTVFTGGGPARWPQELESEAILGADDGPFAIDVLKRPTDNPWFCRMRLTGFDFTPDGNEAIVCAWDGSIWRVSGLKQLPDSTPAGSNGRRIKLKWRRIASGLFQPLGVKIVQGEIYVTCRDQICILHDLNGDGEIDHFENFNNDHQVTDHFHEFAMGLQTDADGNFYYAKSARHALKALVPHHGTLLRVSRDGSRTDIVANGFRAANGVCINPDGTFIVTDQEGHWNPKNRINWVKEGGFYGNMFGYHDVTDSSDDAMEQPLCWITNAFDRSPAELLWVDSPRWGALDGKLLNLSYGYGQVYVVPHEEIDGQKQGGMCALPIPRFPTGVMRGRFHPGDGQLYLCGMFAWAGSQTQPGGLYRLRYTGKPAHLPVGLSARKNGMAVTFTDKLDAASARDPKNYSVKIWSLKRTAGYGSKHYNERSLKVTAASLSEDGKQVFLQIPEIAPTWCMEINYEVQSATGKPIRGKIHNTIHKLNP
ncbi:MAG: heme-binding protein [Planctomycetaceae bacterium]|nr:heme-binding protein [Planctomycetaceae bacterium]MBT6157185.1 heme-binding protein [Planctomycetaceae bacterium]MBT6486966.1 heme-binding protein [Planctomycetaceae bacterium]MBT6492998.1 heme-binding protein [Planctomycetaceae bacterium]